MKSPFDLLHNPDYTRGRIHRSVILYKGLPTYISDTDGRNVVGMNLEENLITTSIDSPNFDFSPINLGYTLYRNSLLFIHRQPVRQWKAGLTVNNCGGIPVEDFERVVISKGFLNTHKGVFSSFEEARATDKPAVISRSLATKTFNNGKKMLLYRGHNAGFIKDNGIILSDKFMFLKEMLEERDEKILNK